MALNFGLFEDGTFAAPSGQEGKASREGDVAAASGKDKALAVRGKLGDVSPKDFYWREDHWQVLAQPQVRRQKGIFVAEARSGHPD